MPLLVDDDGFAVWDSLAIAEYLAERFPDKRLWPLDRKQRARARCLSAEMHSGFAALRERCPMNIEISLPQIGARVQAEWPDVATDLCRIDAMWREALAESGGPFLFSVFGAVDAYFAPVCARVESYDLPLGAEAKRYVARMLALPAMQEWSTAARAEHDFLAVDEPYRSSAQRRIARGGDRIKKKRTEVRFTHRRLPRRQRSQRCLRRGVMKRSRHAAHVGNVAVGSGVNHPAAVGDRRRFIARS